MYIWFISLLKISWKILKLLVNYEVLLDSG
jgi:hypothetical protein